MFCILKKLKKIKKNFKKSSEIGYIDCFAKYIGLFRISCQSNYSKLTYIFCKTVYISNI